MVKRKQKPSPRRRLRRGEWRPGVAYAAIPLLGFAVFFAAPFAISVLRTIFGGGGGQFLGLSAYISIVKSGAFQLALYNTLRFIGVGVPVVLALSLVLALMLQENIRGTRAFRAVFVLPLVVPVSAVILVFQIVFEKSGVVNQTMEALGLVKADFLYSEGAFAVLIVLYLWKNSGYLIILFLAGLAQIPTEYYDAARVDGAGKVRTLMTITLPLLVPTFFFTFVISIINAFKSFREAYALAGAYPHASIYMLQHFMDNNFRNLNYQRLSVASHLTFLVVVGLVFFLFRFRQQAGDHQL